MVFSNFSWIYWFNITLVPLTLPKFSSIRWSTFLKHQAFNFLMGFRQTPHLQKRCIISLNLPTRWHYLTLIMRTSILFCNESTKVLNVPRQLDLLISILSISSTVHGLYRPYGINNEAYAYTKLLNIQYEASSIYTQFDIICSRNRLVWSILLASDQWILVV